MSDYRHEVKLLCAGDALPAIRAELRLRPEALVRHHPARIVQSVYFDTHGERAVSENLAGVSDRCKLRFRWYGEAVTEVRGQLELKIRRNKLGTKRTHPIAAAIDVEGTARRELARALASHSPPEWREELVGLEPTQWIRYGREYWITGDRRIRVTLDEDIRAFDLREARTLSRRDAAPLPYRAVVECKGPADSIAEIEALTGGLPLHVERCSKYVLAARWRT